MRILLLQLDGKLPNIALMRLEAQQVRHKRDLGRCYRRAGFRPDGFTQGGLFALRLAPEDMPTAMAPSMAQTTLWV